VARGARGARMAKVAEVAGRAGGAEIAEGFGEPDGWSCWKGRKRGAGN